jgi:moderate conductance mechanosensitive channel
MTAGGGMRSFILRLSALMIVLAGIAAVTPAAQAQETSSGPADTVTLPDQLTHESINALVSRLSDAEVRSLLLERLDAVAAEQTAVKPMGGYETLGALLIATAQQIWITSVANVQNLPDFLATEAAVLQQFARRLGPGGVTRLLIAAACAIAVGLAAERIVHWAALRRRDARTSPADIEHTLRRAAWWLVDELIGALIFAGAAMAVLQLLKPDEPRPMAAPILFWIVFMPRFAIAILRFFLAPYRPYARLVSLDDRSARVIYFNFVGIALGIGATFAMSVMNKAFGGAPGFWFWFNLWFFGWMALLFILTRNDWRAVMEGGRTKLTAFDAWSIHAYPYLAVLSIVATWAFCVGASAMNANGVLSGGRHFVSMAIVLVAPLLDTLIHAVVRHFMKDMAGEGEVAQAAYGASRRAYIRIGRVLVFGAVLLATARLWQVTPVAMASAGVGDRLASTTVKVCLIAVIGYLIWEMVRLAINIRLAREQTADTHHGSPVLEHEGMGGKPTTRLGTILPPISLAAQIVVLTVTVLTVLANLGLDVTALLAGAGIVGIAIGFGAQKLVSDVISGMFFLIDDAFRMNEYVNAGGSIGTVDRISLRSIRLRDAKGPVLIVPYSEIKTVINYGRDWGIMKLRFTVPFDTDVERVRKIFKKIGQEMLEDPFLGPGFIEPFKSQGVYEYNDHGIVLRGKFTHKPGAQFEIRKKVYLRVKEEFEKAGIQFARREVKVNLDGAGQFALSDKDKQKISAAAAESIAQTDQELEIASRG